MTNNYILEKAMEYLEQRKWSVIPMNDKTPLVKWKPYQEKLPSASDVRSWWVAHPSADIGIVLGGVSGNLVVMDVDDNELAERLIKNGICEITTVVKTPRGLHVYLRETDTVSRNSIKTILGPKVDLKATGGCVVAPPSPGYLFLSEKSILVVPSAIEYAKELLTNVGESLPDSNGPASPVNTFTLGQSIIEGQRNSTLFRLGSTLRDNGYSLETIHTQLDAVNETYCQPPLDNSEVAHIATQVVKYGPSASFVSYPPIYNNVRKEYKNIRELLDETPPTMDWVWRGFIAKEMVTLLSGHPRAGKTTLIFHLLRSLLNNEPSFLNYPIKLDGNILYLTQESKSLFVTRCREFGITSPKLIPIFKFGVSSLTQLLGEMERDIQKLNPALLVVDTIASFWNVDDEYNAATVTNAVRPICDFVQRNKIAALMNHHLRKTGGQGGQAVRGSNALVAESDIALVLNQQTNVPTRRELESFSKVENTPKKVIIELRDGAYHNLGRPEDFEHDTMLKRVIDACSDKNYERYEIIHQQMVQPKPDSLPRFKKFLDEACSKGQLERKGGGKRGDPHLYKRKGGSW